MYKADVQCKLAQQTGCLIERFRGAHTRWDDTCRPTTLK